ncbi:MAG: hypothetical protein AAGE80_07485 [Pseudomonadota bacterium]
MSKSSIHPADPRDLIGDAFRIEGISTEDCRSIFFDWALGLDVAENPSLAARALLAHHAPAPEHPMTVLLKEAAEGTARPRRRRGRRPS